MSGHPVDGSELPPRRRAESQAAGAAAQGKVHKSAYERGDFTALPAAGVIAESIVALVLADALLDKLDGDSLAKMVAH